MLNLISRFFNRGAPPPKDQLLRLSDSASFGSVQETFKIATWNLWKQRHEKFYPEFTDLWAKTDILCGQEFWMKNSFLGINASVFFGANFNYKGHYAGQITASRFDTQLAFAQLSLYKELFLGSQKGVLITQYDIWGRNERLLVINIHGLLTRGLKEWKQLVDYGFFVASNHSGPVVYLGDFNTKDKERADYLSQKARDCDFTEHYSPMQARYDRILTRNIERLSYKVLELESSNHPAILLEAKVI